MKQTRRSMVLDKAGAQEAVNTYMADLSDLTVNSKPHINALTMLAEDYLNYAEAIVKAIDDHLLKVPSDVKLPILYLIDSILKNVGKDYINYFNRTIVQSFSTVFKQVDERTRTQMYKLRQTWNELIPPDYLYHLDMSVNALDPNWPITAAPASSNTPMRSSASSSIQQTPPCKILINPKFLQSAAAAPSVVPPKTGRASPVPAGPADETALREQLLQRKKDLLQLQQEKVVLELSQMKAKLHKKERAVSKLNEKTVSENLMSNLPTAPVEAIELEEDNGAKFNHKKRETTLDTVLPSPSLNVPRIAPVSSSLVNLITSTRARDPRLSKQPKEDVSDDNSVKPQAKVRDPRLATKQATLVENDQEKTSKPPGVELGKQLKSLEKHSVKILMPIPKETGKQSKSAEKEPEKRLRSSDKDVHKRSRSSDKELQSRSKSSDKEIDKRSRSSDKELVSKSTRRRSREDSLERGGRHSDRRDDREKRSSESRKSTRKSEDRTSSRSKKTSSHSPSKSSTSSSKSSLKRDRRREISRSPRKPAYTGCRPLSDIADSSDTDSSDSKVRVLSPRASASSGSSEWPVNYTKGSYKARNYVRKNQPDKSPDISTSANADVDLRVIGPPEKQIRLSNSSELLLQSSSSTLSAGVPEQILPAIASQDVDLRHYSPTKKRQSAEPEVGPPPSKKNKAAKMEMLFGSQDVDLRQKDINNGLHLPSDAPSPPPPPIISSPEGHPENLDDSLGWSKFKQTLTPSPTVERAFPRLSRHDRLGRSSGESELRQNEDTDMRIPINGLELSARPNYHAILATAAEQFKNGIMSDADFRKLMHMHELEKIREAKQNDCMRPWERRPQRERDYRHGMGSPETEQFGDIDERFTRPGKKTLLPLPDMPPMAQPMAQPMGPRHMMPRMSGYARPPRAMLRGSLRPSWRYPRGGPGGFKENTISLPQADPFILKRIDQDPVKTIAIDGVMRHIRFYGDDAVVFLQDDRPCEIKFQPGDATVLIDDAVVHCSFHSPGQEVNIGGKVYRVRLGAPTRELYVNDEGFDCQFNSPPKKIFLATGEIFRVQLQSDGNVEVHVGGVRRDLVAGFVMLIVDAAIESATYVFLDAKPQRFDIDGVPHVIKFADALETVLVNGHPFNIQFGGPAVPITVNDRRHYMRLTKLPAGVVPGAVDIVSMSHFRTSGPSGSSGSSGPGPSRPALGAWASGPALAAVTARNPVEDHEPALPVRGGIAALNRGMPKKILKPKTRSHLTDSLNPARIEDRQMPAELLQAIQPGLPSLLGLLPGANSSSSSAIPSGSVPVAYGVSPQNAAGTATTSILTGSTPSSTTVAIPEQTATTSTGSNGIPFLAQAPELDISKLLQNLHDSGIISSISSLNKSKKNKAKEDKTKIREVDFKESSTLKVKQPAIIDLLYSGIQCSSCGTRFPAEQAEKYGPHLDWHFRQNRRDKDSARKPQSRKWYYDVTDWVQFEEIDDTVEKAQNWFDTQQTEAAKLKETEEVEIQSVPSNDFPEGTICELCHERFDQFYDEEKDEWHLKDCMVADGLPYHPFCYKDYRTSVDSNEEPVEQGGVQGEDNSTEDKEIPADEIKKEPEEAEKMDPKEEMKIETEIETKEPDVEPEPDLKEGAQEALNVVVKQEVEDPAESNAENDTNVAAEPADGAESEVKEEENEEEPSEAVPLEAEPSEPKTLEEVLMHDPPTDTTSAVVQCSIDGNLELAQAPATLPAVPNRIKINISKPIVKPSEEPVDNSDKESERGEATVDEAVVLDEEPIVLKPKLEGRKLSVLPPKLKGTETSGLCSVM